MIALYSSNRIQCFFTFQDTWIGGDGMRSSADYENGVLNIRLSGELDHCAAAFALQAIESAVEEYMPRQCVLDFSELSFMDSSGIAVILKTERLMRHANGDISIRDANAQVRRVLELAGLNTLLLHMKKECETI